MDDFHEEDVIGGRGCGDPIHIHNMQTFWYKEIKRRQPEYRTIPSKGGKDNPKGKLAEQIVIKVYEKGGSFYEKGEGGNFLLMTKAKAIEKTMQKLRSKLKEKYVEESTSDGDSCDGLLLIEAAFSDDDDGDSNNDDKEQKEEQEQEQEEPDEPDNDKKEGDVKAKLGQERKRKLESTLLELLHAHAEAKKNLKSQSEEMANLESQLCLVERSCGYLKGCVDQLRAKCDDLTRENTVLRKRCQVCNSGNSTSLGEELMGKGLISGNKRQKIN